LTLHVAQQANSLLGRCSCHEAFIEECDATQGLSLGLMVNLRRQREHQAAHSCSSAAKAGPAVRMVDWLELPAATDPRLQLNDAPRN
jgi:hypothetical protein